MNTITKIALASLAIGVAMKVAHYKLLLEVDKLEKLIKDLSEEINRF